MVNEKMLRGRQCWWEDEVDEKDDVDGEDDFIEGAIRKEAFQNIVQVVKTATHLIQLVTGKLASVMHGFSVF